MLSLPNVTDHMELNNMNPEELSPPSVPTRWAVLAEEFATKAHQGQFRRDGITPYITHPAAVAAAVEGDIEKAVAWLHDVLEDTDTQMGDLVEQFTPGIASLVVVLTNTKSEPYEKYINLVNYFPVARVVKVADIHHNLSCAPTAKQVAKYAYALSILMPEERT